ncbi:M23 family metallopeptidase [Kaistia dalseonensis]|uniref:Murein DD-endopeptidase MepM/ murein hydrolase activator NlpD n=1 Tax=Kaistia dalseonensis TaxID=410840 RepID=A0ABU0H3J6_9HYPH|nr:M23 family metallopeptidase [Kaistia dalseonensis]MCX5494282.1 M23 family metallopeptidase [Kaistia dalseonensis]MDQ0436862.1 murein DD-endopeptidase MepM/ murein hydrolase activator NlpD [Kaistia dalseonensis]
MHGEEIDLGHEPPLSVGTSPDGAPQRRSVSIRWLAGTILTGLTSTVLMGGALMAALDGRHQLAVPPETGRVAKVATADPGLSNGHKGDRIRPTREPISDRQVIQVSTVSRQGDRDLIKMKPFAKIATSLATSLTDLSDNVPKFDPMRLAGGDSDKDPPIVANAAPAPSGDLGVVDGEGASGDGDSGDGIATDAPVDADGAAVDGTDVATDVPPPAEQEQIYGANVDGEISVKVTDFPITEDIGDDEPQYDVAEVEQILRSTLRQDTPGPLMAAIPYVDPQRFSFDESGADPFTALGVTIVPENVSFVSKATPTTRSEEIVATVDKKQSLKDVLDANGVSDDDTGNIVSAMSDLIDLSELHAGQKIRLLVSVEGDTTRPMRVSIYDEGVHQATVARRDDDTFIRADEPESSTDEFETADQPETSHDEGPMPTLYSAIYETALQQKMPEPLVDDLIRIFSYDVDFQARVAPGDGIEVFHSLPEDGGSDADDEILYAAITIDGATKRYYRYRSPDDGVVDYFDEDGRSAKKFLVRKPMNGGIVRSPFGYRRHPILGYVRLHPGVDWAAPRGTAIMAAGNGVVEKAGWSAGYGNFTLIRHTNGYETAYGHQSAILRGIRPGMKVRQGQVIGYVGSTGLSTGPHLHYEVRINGKPVDPLRVRLPRGRVLQGDMLTAFNAEKVRIDTLLGMPAGAKVASVDGVTTR